MKSLRTIYKVCHIRLGVSIQQGIVSAWKKLPNGLRIKCQLSTSSFTEELRPYKIELVESAVMSDQGVDLEGILRFTDSDNVAVEVVVLPMGPVAFTEVRWKLIQTIIHELNSVYR